MDGTSESGQRGQGLVGFWTAHRISNISVEKGCIAGVTLVVHGALNASLGASGVDDKRHTPIVRHTMFLVRRSRREPPTAHHRNALPLATELAEACLKHLNSWLLHTALQPTPHKSMLVGLSRGQSLPSLSG